MTKRTKFIKNLVNLLEAYTNKEVYLTEQTMKLAKQNFLQKNLISKEDYDKIVSSDPTPTKKYVYWMCKQYINAAGSLRIQDMINTVTEYDILIKNGRFGFQEILSPEEIIARSGRTFDENNPRDVELRNNWLRSIENNRRARGGAVSEQLEKIFDKFNIERPADIYSYKTYDELYEVVREIDRFEAEREEKRKKEDKEKKEMMKEIWVSIDNEDMLVVNATSPRAAHYVGVKDYIFTESIKKPHECPWCISYQNSSYFNSYYNNQSDPSTFYLVKARGDFKKALIKNGLLVAIGIAVQKTPNKILFWDINDETLNAQEVKKYLILFNRFKDKAAANGQVKIEPPDKEDLKNEVKKKTAKKSVNR